MSKQFGVHILCPNSWADGICDSFESRVYFETKCSKLKEALDWVSTKTKDIDNLDDVHGYMFELYINGSYVADINKKLRKFTMHQELFNKVAIELVLEGINPF